MLYTPWLPDVIFLEVAATYKKLSVFGCIHVRSVAVIFLFDFRLSSLEERLKKLLGVEFRQKTEENLPGFLSAAAVLPTSPTVALLDESNEVGIGLYILHQSVIYKTHSYMYSVRKTMLFRQILTNTV